MSKKEFKLYTCINGCCLAVKDGVELLSDGASNYVYDMTGVGKPVYTLHTKRWPLKAHRYCGRPWNPAPKFVPLTIQSLCAQPGDTFFTDPDELKIKQLSNLVDEIAEKTKEK